MDCVLAAVCVELALAWGGFVALVRLSSPPAVYALAPLSVCMNVCVLARYGKREVCVVLPSG